MFEFGRTFVAFVLGAVFATYLVNEIEKFQLNRLMAEFEHVQKLSERSEAKESTTLPKSKGIRIWKNQAGGDEGNAR